MPALTARRFRLPLVCPDPSCPGHTEPEPVDVESFAGATFLVDEREWECGYCGAQRRFAEGRGAA
jgi:hypothetical protein